MTDALDAIGATAIAAVAGGEDRMGARDAALCIWEIVQLGRKVSLRGTLSKKEWDARTLISWLELLIEFPSRQRKTPVNVKALVKAWVPIIRGLGAAHSKDELDRCEFEAEQHLAPLLTAPVKQIRQFFAELCQALEADPSVPFFVWSMFSAWHEVMLKKAPDQAVVELKTALATEIATLVEGAIRPDIHAALVGALQWRPAEALAKVKAAVEAGAKPRLKGKESCLFLVIGEGKDAPTVML